MSYRSTKNSLRALTALANAQGGYFTAKQAQSIGYDFPHLSYHLSAGNFERAGHGLYRLTTVPFSEHDDLIRLYLWSRSRNDEPQGVVSHQTALSLYELGELIPSEVHLTVPEGFRKRPPKGCILHKQSLGTSGSKDFTGFRVTTPLQTLESLATDHSISHEQFSKAVRDATDRGLIRNSQKKLLLAKRKQAQKSNPQRPHSYG